jgi:hypothetical protein
VHPRVRGFCASSIVASLALASGCGLVGPSCTTEDVAFLNVSGRVAPGETVTHTVVSPKSSNLVIRLSWADLAATLGLSATITNCGGHIGCSMDTFRPSPGPGGSSSTTQWPPGLREITVDGWQGKTYLVEITTEADRDVSYTLQVTYHIACER